MDAQASMQPSRFSKYYNDVLYPSYLSMEEIVENKKIMYLLHTE